jgi:hypothetical protein
MSTEMINTALRTVWPSGLFYLLILLAIALWVRDVPNQPDAFATTLPLLIQTSEFYRDPVSFATAALDIAAHGWISPENDWILNLWPPGFVLLEALIVKIVGQQGPSIFVLQLAAAALFAGFMTLVYQLLRPGLGRWLALLLPMVIFVFPMARLFLLEPQGVVLGESYAIGFFLIGVVCTVFATRQNTLRRAAYAGASIALAAYFRSQFEVLLLSLSFWGVLLVAWLAARRYRSPLAKGNSDSMRNLVMTIVVTLIVAHALTLPWRIYHWVHQRSVSWVQTSSLIFINSVRTSEDLERNHGDFIVAGAGNLTCRIDPSTCGHTDEARALFMRTFLNHPIEWYSLKLAVIGPYWFSSIEHFSVASPPGPLEVFTNAILLVLLAGLAAIVCIPAAWRQPFGLLSLWLDIAIFSAYGLLFSLTHFEVRYFYFPKIYGASMFLLQAALAYSIHKEEAKGNFNDGAVVVQERLGDVKPLPHQFGAK